MNTSKSAPPGADRPIPELLHDLASELKQLVRDELELVRIELARKGKKAGTSAGMFGAATLFALGAFAAFTAALIALISNVLPVWIASLVVTVVYLAAAGIAALVGKRNLDAVGSPVPERAATSVRRDVDAMRAGAERGR